MTLVIIPVRMSAARLPNKPMELIGRRTIIEHCIDRACEADLDPWVATDSEEIKDVLQAFGFKNIAMTGPADSGTDRVAIAAEIIDPEGTHKFVVNYQGDMPFLDPVGLKAFVEATENGTADITTAMCQMPVVECYPPNFRRTIIHSHIGLYGYTREALRRFHAMPQGIYEKAHSLEQLRNPHAFTWQLVGFNWMPIEINKKIDLEEVRRCRV